MKNSLSGTEKLIARGAIGAVAVVGVLVALHFRPRAQTALAPAGNQKASLNLAREELAIGFLPVTCHLTCPVTDFATRTSSRHRFSSQRFTDWPTVAEALKSGRLRASFLIAPLAMKLREQGVPIKIVYLGHRDGSTLIVRRDNPAKSMRDLVGKTFAVPSKFSNQYLVVRALMEKQGVPESAINFVELPPPDMPGALAARSIDAYFVGEPFAAKAEVDGDGRVLYFAKDIWPDFISCVLVVNENLIKENPEEVRDLVRGIAQSGAWAQTHRVEAARIAAPIYKQKESLIKYVLTTPPDRVSYTNLTPGDAEIKAIGDASLRAGILKKPVDIRDLVDRQFVPTHIKATLDDE